MESVPGNWMSTIELTRGGGRWKIREPSTQPSKGNPMDAIQLIYIALFGRPADPLGLDFYSLETDNGNNLDAIGDLTSSAEYQNRFEGQTPQQVITSIYNSLFGRNPDAAGLAFYMAEWQSGRADLESIAIRIAQGATGSDVDTLEAKIEAANAFTAAIDADPDLLAAYQGDDAAAVARAWLAPIDASNPGTEAGLDAVLQDLVDAGNAGDTISLTNRIDAPGLDEGQPGSGRDTTGTEGNDRYIANAETPSGWRPCRWPRRIRHVRTGGEHRRILPRVDPVGKCRAYRSSRPGLHGRGRSLGRFRR